jgi:SAM-dependent methyltransferase
MFRTLENCRLCGSKFFPNIFQLKPTPAANGLFENQESALSCNRFPLNLVMCSYCKHVQLREIVNPQLLFGKYIYKSGTSSSFVQHFNDLASTLRSEFPLASNVLEIGSNDGTLMKYLSLNGFQVVGIEPSDELVEDCLDSGLNVIRGYLEENMREYLKEKYGNFDLILGNNVFAHIDDLPKAFEIVYELLEENGYFIFEVAHLEKVLTDGYFDTIYHEHMSYHSAIALRNFLDYKNVFEIVRIEKIGTHGGSLRFFLGKKGQHSIEASVSKIINEEIELGLDGPQIISTIEMRTNSLREKICEFLSKFLKEGPYLIGYGAPAKVVTFLAQMDLEKIGIKFVIDDNLSKQGKFLPGSGIMIDSLENVVFNIPIGQAVLCFIFPWNLSEEIINKIKDAFPSGSRYVNFFPDIEVGAIP